MTEPENHEHDANCYVQFEWVIPDDPDADQRRCVIVSYGTAQLHLDFEDTPQGARDVGRIVSSMPQVISHLRDEAQIKREVKNVDQDLLDLLEEGGTSE